MDCQICCEKLNKSTRLPVKCTCDFSICRTCFQRYLLESNIDAHCMSCKKQFNRDFLTEACTSAFLGGSFKQHRENTLLDREKGLLIETQPYVLIEKEKKKLRDQCSQLYSEIGTYESIIRVKRNQINDLQARISRINPDNINETPEEARKFIRKCPINNCRGFLSTRWKCGTCDAFICNKCNEPKDEEHLHVCDPANVASMELLNKDTKPCPECATMIYRIEGCPQMFCTNCNTPWDWNTGRKVKGVIHNPHYYDFIRNGGNGHRNAGDIPCGGLPHVSELRKVCSTVGLIDNSLYSIHNCITHIENYEMREHRITDIISYNRNLRVKYLLNEISENEFKRILQINEKSREKHRDFTNIYQMFVNVSSDILRQMVLETKKIGKTGYKDEDIELSRQLAREFVIEQMGILNNLVNYFNENIKKIGKSYKVVYPGITLPDYRFINNIETYNRRITNARNNLLINGEN